MRSASHLRVYVLTPSARRAFYRYWVNFSMAFPIKACEEMTQHLRLIDSAFGSSLQSDTESLRAQMLCGKDHEQKESYESDAPAPSSDAPKEGRNRDQELQHSIELLRRVHRATSSNTNVRAYKICALPDDVLPGIRALRPSKNNPTKMQNFTTALDIVSASGEMQLIARASSESDFHRLDVDLSEFERHGGRSVVFGTPRLWGDVFAIRYDSYEAAIPNKSLDPPGVPQDPVPVREVLNLEKLRGYLQYCSDKDSRQIDSILGAATPVGGDGEMGSLVAMYSNTSAYGRKYARSASAQKLSRAGGGTSLLDRTA